MTRRCYGSVAFHRYKSMRLTFRVQHVGWRLLYTTLNYKVRPRNQSEIVLSFCSSQKPGRNLNPLGISWLIRQCRHKLQQTTLQNWKEPYRNNTNLHSSAPNTQTRKTSPIPSSWSACLTSSKTNQTMIYSTPLWIFSSKYQTQNNSSHTSYVSANWTTTRSL